MENRCSVAVLARAGSTRLPGKNTRLLDGEPLIARTLKQAIELVGTANTHLSSDDETCIEIARDLGLDTTYRRPKALSGETASSEQTLVHLVRNVRMHDTIVLLQPTSPLRVLEDVTKTIRLRAEVADPSASALAVVQSGHGKGPVFEMHADGALSPVTCAPHSSHGHNPQRLLVQANGAAYSFGRDALLRSGEILLQPLRGHLMPVDRSVDIDFESDLIQAQNTLAAKESRV